MRPSHIVLGPGPGTPEQAGITMDLLRNFCGTIPILGVCLGHQAIGIHYGARLVESHQIQHGRQAQIVHDQTGLFKRLPSPLQVGRYHSLMLTDIPDELTIDATSSDGTVMAISHKIHPTFGVQFHPESILSVAGLPLLSHFMELT